MSYMSTADTTSPTGPYLITNTVCPDSFLGTNGATRNPDEAHQYPTEADATRALRGHSWFFRARIVTLDAARATAHLYDPRCDHIDNGTRCPRHRHSGRFHCNDHLTEGS